MTCEEIRRVGIIQKVVGKALTGKEAGELLNLSTRQIKRLIRKYRDEGTSGIISKNIGGHRVFSESFKAEVIHLIVTNYSDFKPSFASEKLKEINGLEVSRETLRKWMIAAGIWKGKRRAVARIHQSRARRERYGEMIQIDGSHHDWFEGRAPKCCLLVFIDDATSSLMHLRFEEGETTLGYFACLKTYIKDHGVPFSIYSDKHGVFVSNMPDKIDGKRLGTQFERAMRELKIETILANSPQAKGRVERANGVLQDRLIKEMRLREINNIEEANAYLPEFIKDYNTKFAVIASNEQNMHRSLTEAQSSKLDIILSHQEIRSLSKNLEFSYNNDIYQIQAKGIGYGLRYMKVSISHQTQAIIVLTKEGKQLAYKILDKKPLKISSIVDRKALDILLDKKILESGLCGNNISSTYPQAVRCAI